jgi:hypothetical protein
VQYSDRLQTIKECDLIEAVKGLINGSETYLNGVNSKEVFEDIQWLIEQSEKVERYEKALKTIVGMETIEKRFGKCICTATGIIAQKTLDG